MLPLVVALAAVVTPLHLPLRAGFAGDALVAADFNRDGKADIAVAGDSGFVAVFLNDGGGRFRAPKYSPCGEHPVALAVADADGDGKVDIVVANHEMQKVTLLRGDGAGGFTATPLAVQSRPHPHMIAVGDIDSDKRPEIITDSWGEDRLLALAGRLQWRGVPASIPVGRKPYYNLVAADLDGDGHIDLVTPNQEFGTVSILLGDGRGHFAHAPGSPFAAGATAFSAAVGDLNGDHRPDIAIANYSGHAGDTANDGLTWIRNDGHRRFTPFPQRVATGRYTSRLAVGDVNADGIADVALPNTATNIVTIIFGSRDGPRATATVMTMNAPHAVSLADFDGDGRADLAVTGEGNEVMVVMKVR